MSEGESERQVEEGERKFLSPKLGECSVCAEAPLIVTEMADGSRPDPVQQGAVDGTRNVVASVAQETQIRKFIEMNAHTDPLWRNALTEWMSDVKQYT